MAGNAHWRSSTRCCRRLACGAPRCISRGHHTASSKPSRPSGNGEPVVAFRGDRSMAVFPRSGAHDLGGMEGLGPVPIEADEAPWHEVWEGRTLGATLAAVVSGMLVPPTHRAVIEALHPVT